MKIKTHFESPRNRNDVRTFLTKDNKRFEESLKMWTNNIFTKNKKQINK